MCAASAVSEATRATVAGLGVVALALLASLACAGRGPAPEPEPPRAAAPPAPEPAPPPTCERIEALSLRKSARTLVVRCAGGGALELPVALARVPGRKEAAGDQ